MGKTVKLRDMVVLGLLNEQPRYGYEIKMIIDHIMSHFLDISSGSLYYGIKKLQQSGYIEETTIEKVGRRPERSVYRITAEGKRCLAEQLPDYIFPRNAPFFPIHMALFFFDSLPVDERVRRLKMFQERLRISFDGVNSIIEKYQATASRWHIMILEHRNGYTGREIAFVDELLQEIPGSAKFQLTEADRREIKRDFDGTMQSFDYDLYLQRLLEEEFVN